VGTVEVVAAEEEDEEGRRSMTQRSREESARASPPDVEEGEVEAGKSEAERKTSLRSERVTALSGMEGGDGAGAVDGSVGAAAVGGPSGDVLDEGGGAERLKLNLGFAAAWDLREARRSWRDLCSC
jgi:hypothetical protein